MPTLRKWAIGVVAVAGALAILRAKRPRRRAKQRHEVVCGSEIGLPGAFPAGATAQPGDFVELLARNNHTGHLSSVWAIVRSAGPELEVEVAGSLGPLGAKLPKKEAQGLESGTILYMAADCVGAWLPTRPDVMALCGFIGHSVSGREPPPGRLENGSVVEVYLWGVKPGARLQPAPGFDVAVATQATIKSQRAAGSLLVLELLAWPEGLAHDPSTEITVTRDCVYGGE